MHSCSRLRQLVLVFTIFAALSVTAHAQVDVRLSGTSAILGEGDTAGLVLGLRGDVPLTVLDLEPARDVQMRAFGGVSGLRTRQTFAVDYSDAFPGDYEHRTLGIAEVGLALRAGWIELAVGTSVRYRSESFIRRPTYAGWGPVTDIELVEVERTDVGGVVELGLQVPLTKTFGIGLHTSLRRYNEGTQMVGLGLSGARAF